MPTISQTIPNYYGGISDQPDELKLPGQVKRLNNALPDVTTGLTKRPGSQLVGTKLDSFTQTDPSTKWFHYYRDENEQYIGQIKLGTGEIKMWRCDTGAAVTVNYESGQETALKNYLKQTNSGGTIVESDVQALTLNDYTYLNNRNKTVALTAAVETDRPKEAYIELKRIAYARQYAVNLFDNTDLQTIKTATRISIQATDIDTADSTCPSVGTKIFNVGTADNVGNLLQQFTFDLTFGDNHNTNFIHSDGNQQYKFWYIPPEWENGKYYHVGDLIIGDAGAEVYKATTAGISTAEPTEGTTNDTQTIGGITWKNLKSYDYSNTGALYDGKRGIRLGSGNILVNNDSKLTDLVNAWGGDAVATDGDLPFTISNEGYGIPTDWILHIAVTWKAANRNYDDHQSRFILEANTSSSHVVGGKDSGGLDINYPLTGNTIGNWVRRTRAGGPTTPSGRSDLYFRITTIGQAVPEADTTTPKYTARYNSTIDLLHGGSGWEKEDEIAVSFNGGTYIIRIDEISTSKVQANLGLIRPEPTSFDAKTTVTAESILGELQTDIVAAHSTWNIWPDSGESSSTVGIKIIGNGLYISRATSDGDFSISTPVSELLNVLTDSVENIADLPRQCRHGYVVKIKNSSAEEDDYYVKFFGNGDKDGEGVWEECPKPGITTTLDPATMPVQLVRQADGTFKVSQITWDPRQVGDTLTVPEPSFVGKTLNKMLFFRNRLVMLSDENVIMSRPGDFYNFWPKSAITYTATDVIDISCSSEYPAIVYDGIQVNSGLLLFTKNQQFMLTTDSDVLSPLTAKINSLCTYNFNSQSNPISLGTTVGFLDNAGKFARFFEITSTLREGQPEVLEQTKPVENSFPKDIDIITNSRENSIVFFAKKGTNIIYCFKYLTAQERRVQSSWFTWDLSGNIEHMAVLDDALYVIVRGNFNKDVIQKFNIKLDTETTLVEDDGTYRVNLDNKSVKNSTDSDFEYDSGNNWTKFNLPDAYFTNQSKQLCVYGISANSTNKKLDGAFANVTTFSDGGTTKVKIPGNWKTGDVVTVVTKDNAATRSGNVVTINYTDHPFKVGDLLYLDFQSQITDGSFTVASVADDGDSFTITHSSSGTVSSAKDVTITTGNKIILGYIYDMEVDFPTIYKGEVGNNQYRTDLHAHLVIHRVKFSFGPLGVYDITIKKPDKDDWTEEFKFLKSNSPITDTVDLEPHKFYTLPIYEKNTNIDLKIKSSNPSPATLYSMTWEGDYTDGRYKRV